MFQKFKLMLYEILRLLWSSYLVWVMKVLYWTLGWVLAQFVEVWKLIVVEAEGFMAMCAASMPGVSCSFGAASHWIGVANTWLPISESVGLVLAYWTFVAAFCGAKYVWKAVPTTG